MHIKFDQLYTLISLQNLEQKSKDTEIEAQGLNPAL